MQQVCRTNLYYEKKCYKSEIVNQELETTCVSWSPVIFQCNLREEEVGRLNGKVKQLQQEIRNLNGAIEDHDQKVRPSSNTADRFVQGSLLWLVMYMSFHCHILNVKYLKQICVVLSIILFQSIKWQKLKNHVVDTNVRGPFKNLAIYLILKYLFFSVKFLVCT